MSNSSKRHGQTRIETLEDLILMSASAIDVDVEMTELFDPENTSQGVADEFFPMEPEIPMEVPGEIQADPLTVDLLMPVESVEVRIAESGVVEGEAGGGNEASVEIDPFDESAEQEHAPLPFNDVANSKQPADSGQAGTPREFLQLVALSDTNAAADSTGGSDAAANDETAATPAAYSEYVVLNGEDNDAVLEDNGNPDDDLVQLRSTNGTFETIVFRLPTDVLTIDLGSGNDSLVVEGLELGTLTADVFIYGQEGNDSVNVRSLETLKDVYVYDLEGDNSFTSQDLDIGGNLFISDGDGDQSVGIGGIVAGDVSIGSTSGNNAITVGISGIFGGQARIGGSVTIDSNGVGSDNVRISGSISGDFYIDAGDGDFELSSIFSVVGGALFTNVDNGDSTIFLGDFNAGEASYFNSGEGDTDTWLTAAFFSNGLTISNGLGFDELRLDGASTYSGGPAVAPGYLTVNNGDGGSSTSLNETSRINRVQIGEFRLYNGIGTDTIDFNLRDRDRLGTFYADNGDGDTMVEISGTGSMQSATLISDEGNDAFKIDGVDIENDLIINSGNGERTVDIQNSEIGNIEISGSAATATVYGDGDDEIFAAVGNNVIDGGAGDDVLVVYEGTSADFDIQYEADGRVIVEGPGLNGSTVHNELTNVERILFNDREIVLSDQGVDDPPTIVGTDGDDWIAVSDRGGNVEAGDGDDSIYAPFSQTVNEIAGGAGADTLIIYEGGRADYTLRRPSNTLLVEIEGPGLNGNTVINRLTDVEFILFTDGFVKVADLEITPGILQPAAT